MLAFGYISPLLLFAFAQSYTLGRVWEIEDDKLSFIYSVSIFRYEKWLAEKSMMAHIFSAFCMTFKHYWLVLHPFWLEERIVSTNWVQFELGFRKLTAPNLILHSIFSIGWWWFLCHSPPQSIRIECKKKYECFATCSLSVYIFRSNQLILLAVIRSAYIQNM